jgi:hypothetical protein
MKSLIMWLLIVGSAATARGADPGIQQPSISDKDLLAIRELELRVERAYKAVSETPAYKAFAEAKSAMDEKIRSITPEGFQLVENPQTYELKLAPLDKAGKTKVQDAGSPATKVPSPATGGKQ